MARCLDPAKTRLWSDRLKRFADSAQTVADFCRSEGVSALFCPQCAYSYAFRALLVD